MTSSSESQQSPEARLAASNDMEPVAGVVEVDIPINTLWECFTQANLWSFGSWEKATGWSFRLMKWFWIPHFVFVKDRSLEGAETLETIYTQQFESDRYLFSYA